MGLSVKARGIIEALCYSIAVMVCSQQRKRIPRNANTMGKITKKSEVIPPVSIYPSWAAWEAACWRNLQESKELLEMLVTAHERRTFVLRAAALDRLISGKSYRQIGRELWLSPQTISGIKKAIRENGYRSYLERSKKERKKRSYGSAPKSFATKPRGRTIRTKYGKMHIPGFLDS